ncbi:hypothetical protein GEMRC1_002892 [Eukaryota sp. GEM-RC1]
MTSILVASALFVSIVLVYISFKQRSALFRYFYVSLNLVICFCCVLVLILLFMNRSTSLTWHNEAVDHLETQQSVKELIHELNLNVISSMRFVTANIGNIDAYNTAWSYYRSFDSNIQKLSANSKFQDRVLSVIDSFEKLSSQLKISFSLAVSAFNFPSDVTPELEGFSWDVTSDPNYELIQILQRDVSLGNRYTNTSFDLNRPVNEQLHLARFLLSGRSFIESIQTVLNELDSISNDLVETVIADSTSLSSGLDSFYLQSLVLVIVIALFALAQVIVCVLLRSNTSQTAAHVKQKIDLLLIRKFQKQSVMALVVVSIALCSFFVLTIFGASYLSAFPEQIQLAGLRASLVDRCTSVYLDAYSQPEIREQSFHFLTSLLDQLEDVHSSLLYTTPSGLVDSSAGRHSEQSTLIFDTRFNENPYNSTTRNLFGLNFLLYQFVHGMRVVINGEIDADFRSSIFQLVEVAYALTDLGLDSIDIYHSEITTVIALQRLFSVILLVVFVIVVTSLYILVFRRILTTLTAEEEISLHLLSMIPASVVDDSPHIRQFISQFG